jgi:hypothetical protein
LKPPEGVPGTKTTWCIVIDEYTNLGISAFYNAKDKMIEPFCVRLQQQVARGKPVKKLRMDNAGKNKALEQRMKWSDWKLNVQVEYTAWATP